MKAAQLGRTPAHDKGAPRVPQFPALFAKAHLGCYPLLRSCFYA